MSIVTKLTNLYERILSEPCAFPRHIQLLHEKASAVRDDRTKCGINQSSITKHLALEQTRKVIYALTRLDSSEYLLLASRDPAAIDFIHLSTLTHSINNLTREGIIYGNKFNALMWIRRQGVHNLIIYLLESIDCKDIKFNRLGKVRLSFWNRILK